MQESNIIKEIDQLGVGGNIMENLENSLRLVGEQYIKELTIQLIKMDKVASGRLLNSLDYMVLETVDGFLLQIVSEYYLKYIDSGRLPGSFPPPDVIIQWIRDKGIVPEGPMTEKQLAFLIGRKIATDGIPATNILEITYERIYNNIDTIVTNGLSLDVDLILNKAFKI